jgi:hypothetical protein
MKNPMRNLYDRLKGHGFDRKFVKSAVLPDWWEDSLAENPANMAIAEHAIARHLGYKVAQLSNPACPLDIPLTSNFRFKRLKGTTPRESMPAAIVAQRAAKLIADHLSGVPAFVGRKNAPQIRNSILQGHPLVNLQSLIRYCWRNGIAVLHVLPDRLPRFSKKFEGICMYCGRIPIVILGSGRASPPWLAFHLAHEVGHIMLSHVKAGDRPLVDPDIDSKVGNDRQDDEADTFATEILTGEKQLAFKPKYGMDASMLSEAAKSYGQTHAIDPGTVALIYGRSANRWGPAQIALKALKENSGAHEIISQALEPHVAVDDMSESTTRLLSSLAVLGPGFNA